MSTVGDAGDMETVDPNVNLGGPHKGQKFSAFDQDLDSFGDNCAGDCLYMYYANGCKCKGNFRHGPRP